MKTEYRCEYCGNVTSGPEQEEIREPSLFREAEAIINGPRAEDYGDARKSFSRISDLWSDYLDAPVSPADVAMMMVILKLVRLKYSDFKHHDSFVDMLGYIGLAHKVSGER